MGPSSTPDVPLDPPVVAENASPRPVAVEVPTPPTPLISEQSPSTLPGGAPPPHQRARVPTHGGNRMAPHHPDPIQRAFSSPDQSPTLQSLDGLMSQSSQIQRSRSVQALHLDNRTIVTKPGRKKAEGRELTPMVQQILSKHRRFRILLVGKRGSGKSSLVNAVFKVNIVSAGPGKPDINNEILPEGNRYLIVHEELGFGPGDNLQAIRDFISYRTDPGRANDERLHAIWICIPVSDVISGSIGEGVEEILGMRRAPVVVAFTKFDQAVAIEGGSSARASAHARAEQSCRSLFRRCTSRDRLRCLLSFLWIIPLTTLHKFITNSRPAAARSARSNAQGAKSRITPVPLAWSTALRVNRDISIQASIEVGRSRYWRDLWSSQEFAGALLKDCVNVIHTDIVEIWNMRDRAKYLSSTGFKETMSHIVKDLAGPVSRMPSSPVFAEWVFDVYGDSQENIRSVMGYIVDLTVILDDISRTFAGNVSASDTQTAIDRHVSFGRRDRIHRDINSFVTERFAIMSHMTQRDLVLEKIIDLIRQYCVSPSTTGCS